jgi:hypothetical protein
MRYLSLSAAVLVLLATTSSLASQRRATESYLEIIEPQGGLYFREQRLIPGDASWTVFIGTPDIMVEAEVSENIVTVYFILYDMNGRDKIDQYLDVTPSNGFSYTFTNLPRGAFMLLAVGLATDLDEPIASDWQFPIVVIPRLQ